MAGWLRDDNLVPMERIVYRSSVVAIGRFRCEVESKHFRDSGPVGNHLFVFPRRHVQLSYSGGATFIASPNIVTLYNRGQEYIRTPLDPLGDDCDWFAIAPDILADAVQQHRLPSSDPSRKPFSANATPATARLYAQARRLAQSAATRADADESALALLSELLGTMRGSADRSRLSRDSYDRVEAAKDLLRRNLSEPMPLRRVAASTSTSVFHLCRIFRAATGYSLHEYRQQLRLRASLDRIRDRDDLLTTALDLGFNSHSHFTESFRRAFGMTPSAWRRSGALIAS